MPAPTDAAHPKTRLRLATRSEPGSEFGDWLHQRTDKTSAARIIAWLLAWDRYRDETGQAPSPDQLASRFGWHRTSAYRDLDLFRRTFGTDDPGPLIDMLWGARRTSFGSILAARVVEVGDTIDPRLRSLAKWRPEVGLDELERLRRPRAR